MVAYEIDSWEKLSYINITDTEDPNYIGGLGGEYILTANLNSSSIGYDTYASSIANSGTGWLPIGYRTTDQYTNSFTGDFNGNNKVISDIYINNDIVYAGLFGSIYNGAKIYNLGVKNSNITSTNIGNFFVPTVAGILCGLCTLSTIENCNVQGSVSVTKPDSRVGGCIGKCISGTINNCYSNADITGGHDSGDATGGFIGTLGIWYKTEQECYVTNCYSVGTVTATVEVRTSYSGGLIGYITPSQPKIIITSSFYDLETSGKTDTGKGLGKTTKELKSVETFESVWDITEKEGLINNGYPYLSWEVGEADTIWKIDIKFGGILIA